MDILHNLWNIVSTEDENLMKYISLLFIIIEIYVTFKFLTTILNIKYTIKQRNIYIFLWTILGILNVLFIPGIYNIFITFIFLPMTVKLLFKTPIYKSIIALIIFFIISLILESITLKLCFIFFGITPNECKNIIIYRLPEVFIYYLIILLLTKTIGVIKINWEMFESLNKKQKKLLILNLTFVLICIAIQFYLIVFYNKSFPLYITIISLISVLAYSIISIYSIIKTLLLETTKVNLEQSELHNKTLELLYNNMRAFKHDFFNILTAFGGYIYAKDMDGITKYYDKVLDECNINNNLSTLNPEIINNAAIYNILASKYYKADELGIKIDLKVFIDLNQLKMDIYDFSRILGILLDNSIEAASQCEEKIIKIEIRDFKQRKCQILTIENTFLDKNININQLFEKGYTSKTEDKENHGIGLYQISKIIKRYRNILLDTSKNSTFFKQELAIYYK